MTAGGDMQDEGTERGAPRTSLLISATVQWDEQPDPILIQVKNLSATGLGGRCSTPLQVGQRLSVRFQQGETVTGHITWVRDDRFGLAFDRSIDPQAIMRIRAPAHTAPRPIGAMGDFRRPSLKPRFGYEPDD